MILEYLEHLILPLALKQQGVLLFLGSQMTRKEKHNLYTPLPGTPVVIIIVADCT